LHNDRIYIGTGYEKSICLLLFVHGIGDAIMSLPIISQKITDGYDITIRCSKFYAELYTRLGCNVEVVTEQEIHAGNVGWCSRNAHKYGVIYSLNEWSVDMMKEHHALPQTYMEYFASLLGTTIPVYDWISVLRPNKKQGGYCLFSPQASTVSRSYWRANKLFKLLRKRTKVVVPALPSYEVDNGTVWGVRRSLLKWTNRAIDKHKVKYRTLQELIDAVYNADIVVTTDTAALHIASVLGKRTIALFGATFTAKDFLKLYNSDTITIQGEHEGCSGCYMNPTVYKNNKCKGKYFAPKCLASINPKQVIQLI
jgi:ADP-heptose:LPS heptosyltransferase